MAGEVGDGSEVLLHPGDWVGIHSRRWQSPPMYGRLTAVQLSV